MTSHIETTIGRIDAGWRQGEPEATVSVKRIGGKPTPGTATYVTFGASERLLRLEGDRVARQEFLAVAHARFNARHVAAFLESFAQFVLDTGRALRRGDVVEPSGSVVPGGSFFGAVYAARPMLHDPGVRVFRGSDPPTEFIWALPIHAREAGLIRAEGWREFEDRLLRLKPSLADLNRASIV